MAETVCKSKGAALSALETIADIMPRGIQKDTIIAIKKWINENVQDVYMPEELQKKLDRVFHGSEEEQKGRAWVEREQSSSDYVHGSSIKGVNWKHHKMIHEPEHGAVLQCFWSAHTKTWEPCEYWPIIARQQAGKGTGE